MGKPVLPSYEQFQKRSAEQLQQGTLLLERLRTTPRDAEAAGDLQRVFHRFAGMAEAFGHERAGVLGKQGDGEILALVRGGAAPDADDIDNWATLLASIRDDLARPPVVPEAGSSTLPPKSVPRPPTVLIVGNDAQSRRTLPRLLSNEGFAPQQAATQKQALEMLRNTGADAILTEDVLADGRGCELVEHVRAMPEGEDLPIVVLSPYATFTDKIETIHCGADACFEKPVNWQALVRSVKHLVEGRRPKPIRVLSVEDDPDQAAFIHRTLEEAGHHVRVCREPAQFERCLREFLPDVVLMDILLPGMSGYDLVRYLRQDERYITLPVIFLTAERRTQSRSRSAKAGGDDYLVKPVDPVLLQTIVSARAERARFVKSLLERDGLTSLLTHTALAERAKKAHADKQRHPQRQHAWVMLDLDHFKSINDRFGHPVGDRVLSALSALLRKRLRQTDTIARYGGEEFAVLFEGLSEAQVVGLVDRLREDFAKIEHEAADKSRFKATLSGGIAMLPPGISIDRWRKAADDALYEAKNGGRNRVVSAAPQPSVEARQGEPARVSA
jgi:diguanylate cyclase (GGDEF)-like protein